MIDQQEVWSNKWCHFRRPWMALNPDFSGTPLFNVEYLRNGTK